MTCARDPRADVVQPVSLQGTCNFGLRRAVQGHSKLGLPLSVQVSQKGYTPEDLTSCSFEALPSGLCASDELHLPQILPRLGRRLGRPLGSLGGELGHDILPAQRQGDHCGLCAHLGSEKVPSEVRRRAVAVRGIS